MTMNDASARRFLSLWLRRLSTDRITRRDRLAPEPLVVAGPSGNMLCLTAVNDAAARLGLDTGMALADARAMFPGIAVAQADAAADAALLERLAGWCLRYTPLVGIAPPDGLMLDITGCAHLFGGEAPLRRDLLRRLKRAGFMAAAAVADTVGAAHALARHGGMAVAPPGSTREALRALPLGALRLDPETVQGLAQSGFKEIGALYPLPRAPLAARFGIGLWRQLDRALGLQGEAITPHRTPPRFSVERAFAEPLVRMEDMLCVAEGLAERLTLLMEQQGVGARGLELLLFRLDGTVQRLAAGTSRPLRDPAFIRRLFADRLTVCEDEYDHGFGYDLVRLCGHEPERLDARQDGLSGGTDTEALARLTDRLMARLGEDRVLRLVEQDTHIPEGASVALPARAAKDAACPAPAPQDTLLAARPLRLFARPQRLDKTPMATAPDGVPLRFRWRRVQHEVVASEGPERIAMEWWRDAEGAALTRDYFRVACQDGARLWLFREGLYHETEPRWFVHGLFA
jgi:protein ImuB